MGYSSHGHKELNMTEHACIYNTHTHTHTHIHIDITESLCVHQKLTQHCKSSYTSIKKKGWRIIYKADCLDFNPGIFANYL